MDSKPKSNIYLKIAPRFQFIFEVALGQMHWGLETIPQSIDRKTTQAPHKILKSQCIGNIVLPGFKICSPIVPTLAISVQFKTHLWVAV